MWARTFEVAIGCWLLMSPFLFRHAADDRWLWITDFGAGALVIVLALISFWRPARRAHLLDLGIALWLAAAGFLAQTPPSAAAQNQISVALLLAMFAIIPTDATAPPESWRNRLKESDIERGDPPARS